MHFYNGLWQAMRCGVTHWKICKHLTETLILPPPCEIQDPTICGEGHAV
jgi:hypothetical protein